MGAGHHREQGLDLDAPSLEVYEAKLDGALANLI